MKELNALCSYRFWSEIDNALREKMYNDQIEIRFLSSNWSHTDKEQVAFLKSLNEFGKIRESNISITVVGTFFNSIIHCSQDKVSGALLCLFFGG